MNGAIPPAPGSLPPTRWEGVLVLCDRFEAAWRAGHGPRIEDYLGEAPEPDRPALLHQLVALELELRRDRGESPTLQEYRSRFPDHADLISTVFDARAPRSATRMLMTTPEPVLRLPAGNGAAPPKQFGRYQILRRLGGGAMGTVYLAHDHTLDRRVALKVPVFTAADGPEVFERFLREARAAAATLHHPNLCPIYDVGQIDGIHYLTMAYIEGRPLSELLRADRPPEPRKTAALVRTLARALAEAHRGG
jgi:protein kinase-like protein